MASSQQPSAGRRRASQARAESTRGRILQAARSLFAELGYAGTSLQAVQARGQVTRGGLFHHFAGKRALFRAVCEEIEAELLGWMSGAANYPGGPWVELWGACDALATAFADPNSRRIILHDAPALLSAENLDAARLRVLQGHLERALAETSIPSDRIRGIARFLLGGIRESVAASDPDSALESQAQFQQTLRLALDGLRLAAKSFRTEESRVDSPRRSKTRPEPTRKGTR